MYDIIKKQQDSMECELMSNKNDVFVGTLNLQYCFTYGCHGYGVANQINTSDQNSANNVNIIVMLCVICMFFLYIVYNKYVVLTVIQQRCI